MGTIYMIKNTIDGKMYVGQTYRDVQKRYKEHCHIALNTKRNLPLYNAMRKYGISNFNLIILEKDVVDEKLDELEMYYIEKYNAFREGYNNTCGGGGIRGWHHTPESREKFGKSISAVMWKINTPERAAKISATQKGRKFTDEHKQHLREAIPDRRGINNSFFGKKHTESTKKKISDANSVHSVRQVDVKTGSVLNTFDSVRNAALFCLENNYTQAKLNSVMYRIYATCYGMQKVAYGYSWIFVC